MQRAAKMKTKYFFANVKKINEDEKTIDVIASTADKDRDGEIILPSAFKKSIKSFKNNPVILSGHQHRLPTGFSPVIGSAIPETIEITDKGLTFTMRFADTKNGEEHWILYRDRHQRAFSVGFIPEKWEDGKGRDSGRTYTQVELLEVSAVPVPSNPKATARAKGYKGYFDDDDSSGLLTEAIKANRQELKDVIAECVKDHFDEILDSLEEIKDMLIPDSDESPEGALGSREGSIRSAGDKLKPEQMLDVFKNVLSNH